MIWILVLWLIVMIFLMFLIVFIFLSFFKNIERNKEKKKRISRIDCIKKASGTIVESQQKANKALVLTVEFQADQQTYRFCEKALLVVEKVEWKGITVKKNGHYPFDVHVGSSVNIQYDPKNPNNAYLVDNIGTQERI